ncbi:MAG: prepilin-type N-terminal cleavage/methylation domain-containing protein [Gammaproteobacteria bacterium]|nr:prepilin-type N-terminal cleavage/methylation domain-containing protein [Gammaproteobacteria bacterium]MCP4091008.1 prepilin-type N-terminal cleavage/methylation domain-containing protein [Gammaproteobacteria bacterium]MCP4277466.1 prepilin-type N-terminal cleavage/methylation domain-containing protein [Gammaproteobacteria bacterium]MCP4831473.1 prepilin-type N-terminal cleavage/methylation domain-containing protein [Gammaproteobacteria bacterium]
MHNQPEKIKTDAIKTHACGFSLTELMIAVAIGTLLIAGALKLFVYARSALITVENIASLEERAAFALVAMETDLLLTGFWGLHSNGLALTVPDSVTAHCSGNDVSNWALQPDIPVTASNNTYTLPCPPYGTAMTGADTLTLRHASPMPTEARINTIQLQTSYINGTLFNDGVMPETDLNLPVYDVNIHAWYVDKHSSEGSLPALRRYALINNGLMQNQEIMPGVEDLQVLLGVDRDDDGIIDGFVEPGNEDSGNILAVRLLLLMRSMLPEPGHKDPERGSADKPKSSYRRINAERTIWLRNQVDA